MLRGVSWTLSWSYTSHTHVRWVEQREGPPSPQIVSYLDRIAIDGPCVVLGHHIGRHNSVLVPDTQRRQPFLIVLLEFGLPLDMFQFHLMRFLVLENLLLLAQFHLFFLFGEFT